MLTLWPILFLMKKSKAFSSNLFKIWIEEKTFVGYLVEHDLNRELPSLPAGFIDCGGFYKDVEITSTEMNREYALHYSVWIDLYCCSVGLFGLILALTKYDEAEN
jgi:hypothetical protein